MRYSFLFALCAFMLCLNAPEVRAESLTVHTDDLMTHTALLPEPVASDNVFKLAATWWLPDWQGSQGSRGSTDSGGGDIVKDDSDCMKHYNLYATCPSPKLSTGVVHPVAGMTCQKSCYCPSEYKYTSSNCSGEYEVSGTSCEGKYNQCVCKSEFRYNSSNCSGEYQVSGTSCGGKYNGCTIRPECTVSSKDCTYGCAGYNSCNRCTSCKSNPDCDVSSKSCGSLGCASYNSCSKCTSCNTDPCSGVSCGANAYCSGGSCYCNSGYTGNANSGCTKVDTCTYTTTASSCSSQCKNVGSSSCTKNGTTYYNGCGSSKCSSGQTCSNGTCVTSCVSGGSSSCSGQTSSCSSSQVQTASCKDCSGTTRYTCRAKTCEEQGYRYACNNSGYVGKGSPCDGKYKECDCAPGYQWLPTYPGSREQTCQIPDKTCSDSGYYGGSSCSSWSGYSFERCASEYGQMGSSCNAAGNVGSGSCDVDSWRRCCHQCSGSGT